MKDSIITLKKCLDHLAQTRFPNELIQEISKWGVIHKSPHGLSFYNTTVDWGYKPHNSLRISDHWNFASHGKLHCQTTTPVPNNTHWAIGRYDENIKKYIILKVFETTKTRLKDTFWFKYYMVYEVFKITINKSRNCENTEYIEYTFLKRYYRLLEEHYVNPEFLPSFA
jgi:hypothetical protein